MLVREIISLVVIDIGSEKTIRYHCQRIVSGVSLVNAIYFMMTTEHQLSEPTNRMKEFINTTTKNGWSNEWMTGSLFQYNNFICQYHELDQFRIRY